MSGLSQCYPIIRQAFATEGYDWTAGTVKLLLMATGYTPNFSNQFLSDIPAGFIITTSEGVTGRTAIDGYCDGDTTSFGLIVDPRLAASIILYEDTGVPTTSRLITYFDTPDLAGLPQALVGFTYYFYKNVSYGGWFRL